MDDRGGYPALRALVLLEWKRLLPTAARTLGMGAVVTGVLVATGAFTFPRLAFLLAVVGLVPVMGVPMNALRDKLDGGLEFLGLLPVSPRTHAAARLLALVGASIPAALVATAAAVLALQGGITGPLGPRPILQLFLATLLFMVGGAFFATALILRFQTQQGHYVVLALLGSGMVLDRVLPDPVATFLALSVHGWFIPVVWSLGVVAVGAMAWLAFSMACSGIERFKPSADRLTW